MLLDLDFPFTVFSEVRELEILGSWRWTYEGAIIITSGGKVTAGE